MPLVVMAANLELYHRIDVRDVADYPLHRRLSLFGLQIVTQGDGPGRPSRGA